MEVPTNGLGSTRRTVLALRLLAVWMLLAPVAAADPGIAQVLLEAGKRAIDKKQYDDAIVKLQKSLEEDATLVEAHYWLGLAHDKKGDVPAAVSAYRSFRDGGASADVGSRPKAWDSLLKKAEARLGVLAAAESELDALNGSFVNRGLAFAKANLLKDPALCAQVLHAVLKVRPEHAEARKLLDKIQGGAEKPEPRPSKGDRGPYRDVERWEEYVKDRRLGENEGWRYDDTGVVIDHVSGGEFVSPREAYESSRSYVIEIEARILKSYPGKPAVGVSFGRKPEDWMTVHFGRSAINLWRAVGQDQTTFESAAIEPLEDGTWHRLSVGVSGSEIEVFFDGKRTFKYEMKGRDLSGDIGIFYQDVQVGVRMLRIGERR